MANLTVVPPISGYSRLRNKLENNIAKAQALASATACDDSHELDITTRSNFTWVLCDLMDEIKGDFTQLLHLHHEEFERKVAVQAKAVES